MKICTVAYTFYESDNRVRRYAEALVKRGDQVDAIALRGEGQEAFEVIRGVNVYRIQKRRRDERGPFSYLKKLLLFFVRSSWLLTVRTVRSPYDAIHVHSVPDFEIFAALIPRLAGTKLILDIHDIVPEFYASKFKIREKSLIFRLLVLVEKLSAGFANHVIISNHLWHKKVTARSVRPEKCTAIINYPDPSIFCPQLKPAQKDGRFTLCYPGTLNRHQGLDLAIRAVALLRRSVPNIRFLVIGDGPERENLKALIEQLQLEDFVMMRGPVSLEKVADAMAGVDLGVVPKRNDSFGNEAFSTKIMEFMAMGVPVVVSKTAVDSFYFDDNLVRFFTPGDVEDLARRIFDFIDNPGLSDSLRINSARFVEQNNWNAKKGDYFNLVDGLVRNTTSAKEAV